MSIYLCVNDKQNIFKFIASFKNTSIYYKIIFFCFLVLKIVFSIDLSRRKINAWLCSRLARVVGLQKVEVFRVNLGNKHFAARTPAACARENL